MEPIEQIEHHGLTIKVYPDEEPLSPREDDNLGVMVFWHRHYNLGDRQVKPGEYPSVSAIEESLAAEGAAVVLPLYLFDHSGISIATDSGPFHMADSAGWDWGQVGYIYTTAEALRKEYGVAEVTEEVKQRARAVLEGEVKVYDQYLRGEVYGWEVLDPQGEVLDSCWGYFGLDDCLEEAKAAAEGRYIDQQDDLDRHLERHLEEQTMSEGSTWGEDPILLVPDSEPGKQYPGAIEPGYYTLAELVELLREHKGNPDAIQFIADMLEP